MNLDSIKKKLKEARGKQRELRKEIDRLRQLMRDIGEDPDAPEVDLTARNKRFYIQWKDGQKFTEIAREYKLSPTTVSSVCNRIEHTLENPKHPRFKKYKDLLKYK
jgi:Mor family transcriptional regulator